MPVPCIRLASYNIRKARGLDGRHAPRRTLDVINELDADIVVLQEADFRLGDRPTALPDMMIREHTDFRIVPVAQNEVSLGWHGNAVLIRGHVSVEDVRPLTLPGFEPRGAVQLDIGGPIPMRLIAVHLGLLRKDRRLQLHTLRKATAGMRMSAIAGDFNEWSSHRGLEPLGNGFTVHAPGKSYHARRPIAALDRIALSPDLLMADGGVEQGPLARRASDHLPIWADIVTTS